MTNAPKLKQWVIDVQTRRVAKVSGKIVAGQFLPDHVDGLVDLGKGTKCPVKRIRILTPEEMIRHRV
jgi:hypothetical protein